MGVPPFALVLKQQHRQRLCASLSCFAQHLEAPAALYSDNHLLVVHKPAGWHSVPNPTNHNSGCHQQKCLLSFCQEQKWGGGSQQQFLLPLHRLDQPCTGVIMFGKTTKAASRIQSTWADVRKTYQCVIHTENLQSLERASTQIPNDPGCFELSGVLLSTSHSKSKTVRIVDTRVRNPDKGKKCRLTWKVLQHSSKFVMIAVQTNQGRRHMIRALMGQVGFCPIVGDLRYCGSEALPDQSVALHAAQVMLPKTLQLGSTPSGLVVDSPYPSGWCRFFGFGGD